MNRATLFILCGLPYSGKSTLAKELVSCLGFKAVSMDEVMDKKGYTQRL